MIEKQKKSIEIFYCYAREDQKMVEELEKHLVILQNQNLNIKLSYREVTARREWVQDFNHSILTANIILPLISPSFMASNYLRSKDMQVAFERQIKENAHILPIYLRLVDYANNPIENLKFLPQNDKPVAAWRDKDGAFLDISQGIKNVIEKIQSKFAEGLLDKNNSTSFHEKNDTSTIGNSISETDEYEFSRVNDAENTSSKPELISPSIERSSYLFDQDIETSKKKKDKNLRQNKPGKKASPFDQLLPFFNDLSSIKKQNHIPNAEHFNDYEDVRSKAQRKLTNDQPQEALDILEDVDIGSVPSKQRWRLVALRGHCYFGLGKFLPARKEYSDALQGKPIIVPKEQLQEEGMLYLRSAETNRELGNLSEAAALYDIALAHMNTNTQVGYLAEAHWGLALVLFEQINADHNNHTDLDARQKHLLQEAFQHAEYARQLYTIAGDYLNVASITCDIALFEQVTGDLENASAHLKNVIEGWAPMLQQKVGNTKENRKRSREYNNIISAASCYLAGVEIEMHHYKNALYNVKRAQETAERSYTIRKGEAAIMLGVVLEAHDLNDPNVEKAFQQSIDILSNTDLLGAQVHAHDLLGRHFFKVGKIKMGEDELNKARKISQIAMFSQ
jgi:tetratricopeptide (TPR) repeat protein